MGISMDDGMGIAYSTGCIFEAQELGSEWPELACSCVLESITVLELQTG
jgi:hypothetical protein